MTEGEKTANGFLLLRNAVTDESATSASQVRRFNVKARSHDARICVSVSACVCPLYSNSLKTLTTSTLTPVRTTLRVNAPWQQHARTTADLLLRPSVCLSHSYTVSEYCSLLFHTQHFRSLYLHCGERTQSQIGNHNWQSLNADTTWVDRMILMDSITMWRNFRTAGAW